ncbi:hypothetical protein L593_12505 [Salinarchaeum sp. Harcht-Bsk1]|nr:hypothetical protein L593_12505 [Salinarchaeum sp. Harcht-Bsk1]
MPVTPTTSGDIGISIIGLLSLVLTVLPVTPTTDRDLLLIDLSITLISQTLSGFLTAIDSLLLHLSLYLVQLLVPSHDVLHRWAMIRPFDCHRLRIITGFERNLLRVCLGFPLSNGNGITRSFFPIGPTTGRDIDIGRLDLLDSPLHPVSEFPLDSPVARGLFEEVLQNRLDGSLLIWIQSVILPDPYLELLHRRVSLRFDEIPENVLQDFDLLRSDVHLIGISDIVVPLEAV